MSAQKLFIAPAFGTGLHSHLAQAPVRRFALRFNRNTFLTPRARPVRESEAMPEMLLAA